MTGKTSKKNMTTEELKSKTVCFMDNGLFVDFARNAAKGFKKAYYSTPFQSAFVRTNDLCVGKGFSEIEHCLQPLERHKEIDLWVFLDLYQSGLQGMLRDMGKRVWGAGDGEEMELNRWDFKKYLKTLGLPVQHVEHVKGFEALRLYLKKAKNVYVKTSFTRGDFETFKSPSYEIVEGRLDELEHVLGSAKKKDYEFIVEDEIPDAVEVGYDGFTIDGMYPDTAMFGYEIKDCGMIATVKPYPELAAPIRLVNGKMQSVFKGYGYRGFFCSEIRYTKSKESYFIDPCCRLGTPSNELLQTLFDNWPLTLWEGAAGKLVSPVNKAKFGCLAMIVSEWAVGDWIHIGFPKELDQWVKLRFHTRKDGKDFAIPQIIGIPDVGCVIGTGNTLKEAVDTCKQRAKLIEGFQVHVNVEAIDKGLEVIKQGQAAGIQF